MNTWKRHGSGHRPDAPGSYLWNVQPSDSPGAVDESRNAQNHSELRMSENLGSNVEHEYQTDAVISSQGTSPQVASTVNQPNQGIYRPGSLSTASRLQNRKTYGSQTVSRTSDQIERAVRSNEPVQGAKVQKSSRPNYVSSESEGVNRFQFARTKSSPELSDSSSAASSRRQNKITETIKSHITSSRPEHASRVKNLGSEIPTSHNSRFSANDSSSLRHSSSNQSLDIATDSNRSANSYHSDAGFVTSSDEFGSISEALMRQQEEQDLVNMMASSTISNMNGQVQLPIPFPLPPSVFASMGDPRKSLAGILPGNIPLINPHGGPIMQLSHGLPSSPLPRYFHNAGLVSNPEEITESGPESSGLREVTLEDDNGFWAEQESGSRGSTPDRRNFQRFHSDERHSSSMGVNASSLGADNSSDSFNRGQHNFVRENRLARIEPGDSFQHQNDRGQETYSTDTVANSRFMANAQASSSRSNSFSENSWDGSSMKAPKLARDKRGRKPAPVPSSASYVVSKRSVQYDESSSVNVSVPGEDEHKDWIPLAVRGSEVAERSLGSSSLAPAHSHSHHLSGFEPKQLSGSDSMVPMAPMIVSAGSQSRTGDNAGAMPLAFYPTGPPVPFLTKFPFWNFPSESGNFDGSVSIDDNGLDNGHLNPSDKNFDMGENLEHLEARLSPSSAKGASFEHLEEHKRDILNSDFLGHLQNLQYGRFCQDTHYPGHIMYPSPMVFPTLYLQGHFPWDGPGRPLPSNVNLFPFTGYGPRLVPVASSQLNQSRQSGVFQRYGDEVPRYRGGTGTYLPNPVS